LRSRLPLPTDHYEWQQIAAEKKTTSRNHRSVKSRSPCLRTLGEAIVRAVSWRTGFRH
jgi:hypothetical protein